MPVIDTLRRGAAVAIQRAATWADAWGLPRTVAGSATRAIDATGWPIEATALTESAALDIPPFGRGVRLIASLLAQQPLVEVVRDPASGIESRPEPQPLVWSRPDPRVTGWAWKWGVAEDLIEYGNHLSLKVWDPFTELAGLVAVDLTTASVTLVDQTWPVYRVGSRVYDASEVLHITAGARSGQVLGRGVLTQHAVALQNVRAAETYAGQYFTGGATPPGIIRSTDPDLSQTGADNLKSAVMELLNGKREPLVFNRFTEWMPLASDADKAQLIEARGFNVVQVANMLDLDPQWLGGAIGGSSVTYANLESRWIDLVRTSLSRWTAPVEAALSDLVPIGRRVMFDPSALLAGDAKARAEIAEIWHRVGAITSEEIRMAEPSLPSTPLTAPRES